MSTATYPLGMKTYNNHVNQGGYVTWKGTGPLSNPVGVTAGHIRPLTNNDSGNVFPTGFGLPRPMKHYRKGKVITSQILTTDPSNPSSYIEVQRINANLNRNVQSSTGSSLGGGAGGYGLLNQMLDTPGAFNVKQNPVNEVNGIQQLESDCANCQGVGIISSYYPNNTYVTDNPLPTTQNDTWCCNAEKKALKRVRPASTNLSKTYYTTLQQYRQNRCQTYEQKVFNFQSNNPTSALEALGANNPYVTPQAIANAKPGSPLAILNTYFANCQPNGDIYDATERGLSNLLLYILVQNGAITSEIATILASKSLLQIAEYIVSLNDSNATNILTWFITNKYYGMPAAGPANQVGCKLVTYKPNNSQFAQQGAVSSATRTLKLNVETIQTNMNSFTQNYSKNLLTANQVTSGNNRTIPFILKNKAPACNNPPIIRYQNKKACNNLGANYNLARGTFQPPFSSNHFKQSPRNPLM